MGRKEFVEKVGLRAIFALTATCLSQCKIDNGNFTPTGSIDFTLDLNQASNALLANNGDDVIKDRIAKDNNGNAI